MGFTDISVIIFKNNFASSFNRKRKNILKWESKYKMNPEYGLKEELKRIIKWYKDYFPK